MKINRKIAEAMQKARDEAFPEHERIELQKVRKQLSEGEFTLTLTAAQAMILLETQEIGIRSPVMTPKMLALTVAASVDDWVGLQQKVNRLDEQLTPFRKSLMEAVSGDQEEANTPVQERSGREGPDPDRVEGSLRTDFREPAGVRWRPGPKDGGSSGGTIH